MKLEKKDIRRLVIYFFYDADGIVDRYVPVMLEEMKKNSSEVFVVVNGKLTPDSREILQKITPKVFVRENVGFDVWAYKEAMGQYGWEKLGEFDEVVLMNYTIFGPLYPFSEMFEVMNKKDVDFWGITKHHKVDFDCFGTCKYGYIPEHIQSSFLVIRRSLMNSMEYHNLWDDMPMINSYAESVGFYEAIFTKDFTDKGFKSELYIDTSDLEGYTRYPLMMLADELIKNRKCPILKVKSFSQYYEDILGDTIGNCTIDAFNYIKNELEYDTDLIWEHILRTANMAAIKRLMHLNYILPKDYIAYPGHKNPKGKRFALMMHLYFPDLIDECLEYAKSMPANSDLYITVSEDKMESEVNKKIKFLTGFKKITVIRIENRGRDVSSLLIGCAPYVNDYDYICFMHDKKTTQVKPYCAGKSFSYKCFENNLGSKQYVENIITTFEQNPRLGMLTPPPPNHSLFYNILGTEWASNYENTLALAKKLKLKVNIVWTNEPITPLGTMFWFRPKALKPLFDYKWTYEDFPKEPNKFDGTILHAIERIYGYTVQEQGFYIAWVLSDHCARIEMTNMFFSMRELNRRLLSKYYTNNLLDMTQKMESNMCFNWNNAQQNVFAITNWENGGELTPVGKLSKKHKIKQFWAKITPKPIWNLMREIYHMLGGKKWVG